MEIEGLSAPAVLHRLDRVCWDVLGQFLLIDGMSAPLESGSPTQIQVVLTEEAAGQLLLELQARFEEKDNEGGPVQ